MYYVAVDIGCLECEEESQVLGIFTNKMDAQIVLKEAEEAQKANWHGEHNFELFEVENLI